MITGIVAKGLGVGIVPRLLGRDYENVKMLEIEGLEASRTMYMIWPQNQFFSPGVGKVPGLCDPAHGGVSGGYREILDGIREILPRAGLQIKKGSPAFFAR